MMDQDFGFEQFNRERRKFSGRRLGTDRRAEVERRVEQRRVHLAAVTIERRAQPDRRMADRRLSGRRGVEDRRNSAWSLLEGGAS
jgi:hypothetical protein